MKIFTKKTMRALLASLFIASIAVTSHAQKKKKELIDYEEIKDIENYGNYKYVQIIGHTGSHHYSGQTLDDALKNGYGAIEVRLGWKNSDPEHWSNKFYNSMSYGVGFYAGSIGDPNTFGNPNALYGFLDLPIGKQDASKKTVWKFSPALGLTYNLKPYNPTDNPTNDAIGSKFAVYVCLGGGAETVLTRDLDLIYGVDFTHFSNGRSFMPNYGLNMVGVNLGVKYHFNSVQKQVNKDPYTHDIVQARYKRKRSVKVPKERSSHLNILASVGSVQNGFEENQGQPTNRYGTFSGYLEYQYKFDRMHGMSAGLDYFYDESLVVSHPDDQSLYAFHLGYDYTFWRITVKSQLGGYIGGDKGKQAIWARPAIQVRLHDYISFHGGLKTRRGFAADWVEIGLVIHPFK